MLTLFTLPKPFRGHIADIQHNAIASWAALGPAVRVIVMGDDEGAAEAAAEHGVEHVARVARSPEGTPLLSDAFAQVQRLAETPLVGYANADIILLPELLAAASQMRLERFLLVGRRTNLDVQGRQDGRPGWLDALVAQAAIRGQLHAFSGIDYFVFPRGQLAEMPPFPVGRPLWDNWMIFSHRQRGIPVVDATESVTVLHQNHHYGHVEGGIEAVWHGPEAQRNWAMLGPDFYPFTIADATRVLRGGRLRPNIAAARLLRHAKVWPALVPGLRRSVRVARYVRQHLKRRR
jgi:hypothetical protein